MPSCKSDITVTIKVGEKSFTIGGVLLPDGRYAIKRGRSWAEKMPRCSLTEIFELSRKLAVKYAKG
jgi:hypothetical protein